MWGLCLPEASDILETQFKWKHMRIIFYKILEQSRILFFFFFFTNFLGLFFKYPFETFFFLHIQSQDFYSPGIYAEWYIVFVFPFIRSYVRSFVRSFVLPSRSWNYFKVLRSSNSSGVYLTYHSSESIHIVFSTFLLWNQLMQIIGRIWFNLVAWTCGSWSEGQHDLYFTVQ